MLSKTTVAVQSDCIQLEGVVNQSLMQVKVGFGDPTMSINFSTSLLRLKELYKLESINNVVLQEKLIPQELQVSEGHVGKDDVLTLAAVLMLSFVKESFL